MTYYPPPQVRTIELPLMTPDDADRLLDLLETIVGALRARADAWHEQQLYLPLHAALEIAFPPSAAQLARDQADAERLDEADLDSRG